MKPKQSKSNGSSIFDRLLVPRIESHGLNNDITDVEEVTEYLRRSYKEYQRQKTVPFKKQVERAIEIVLNQGETSKPELRLQVCSVCS